MSVRRFEFFFGNYDRDQPAEMYEHERGDYVRFDDYEEFQSQLAALKEENERLIKECNTWVNQYDCARVENEAAIVKINELSNVLWKLINCGALSEEAKFTSIDGSMKILSDVLGEI